MAFPSSPTNQQQATVNGVIYTYDTGIGAWTVLTNIAANITADTVSASGNISGGQITANSIVSSNVSLSGGSINGTSIGASATSTGAFTSLTATSITESSSIALKENVNPITDALGAILQLSGVTYDRIDGTSTAEAGLIKEEVEKVLPNLVNGEGIQYTKLTAYLIEAIKELEKKING